MIAFLVFQQQELMHSYGVDSSERRAIPFVLAGISILLSWFGYRILQILPSFFPQIVAVHQFQIPWWISAPSALALYGILYSLFDRFFGGGSFCRSVRLSIHQTWNVISICADGENVYSQSLMASLNSINPDRIVLSYQYLLKLKPHFSKDNSMHYGTSQLMIEMKGAVVKEPIVGEYYTDRGRQSFGEIFLSRTSPERIGTDIANAS